MTTLPRGYDAKRLAGPDEDRGMTDIVYNAEYGGFSLSPEALALGRKLSGDPAWGEREYDLSRTDPVLAHVVRHLGKIANGLFSDLQIREVSAGTRYRIDEYDGLEEVVTYNEQEWSVA